MEKNDNQFFEDLDRLFVIIWKYIKSLRIVVGPITSLVKILTETFIGLGEVITNNDTPFKEKVRNMWYRLFPSKEMPFEWIIDERNVEHYTKLSMDSVLPRYLRSGNGKVKHIFTLPFNRKIKEIRYIPRTVTNININYCLNLVKLPVEFPPNLVRLVITDCDRLPYKIPILPNTLKYIDIGCARWPERYLAINERHVTNIVTKLNLTQTLTDFVNG